MPMKSVCVSVAGPSVLPSRMLCFSFCVKSSVAKGINSLSAERACHQPSPPLTLPRFSDVCLPPILLGLLLFPLMRIQRPPPPNVVVVTCCCYCRCCPCCSAVVVAAAAADSSLVEGKRGERTPPAKTCAFTKANVPCKGWLGSSGWKASGCLPVSPFRYRGVQRFILPAKQPRT